MRRTRGIDALALLFSSATLAACVYPTRRDSSVHVSVTRLRILIRGKDTTAKATAWQMVAPGDSQRIPNVSVVWSSSKPAVATVDNAGHIVGVNSGTVVIRAAAANFDKGSATGDDTLRVSAPLEIDSVRPKTVKYGEKLTIYGVGADSIFSASLAGAALIHVPLSDTVFKSGTARTRFWVPPPATTDSLGWNGTAKTYVIGRDAWTFGPGSHACHGAGFSPSERVADSTVVAFKNLPAGALDGIALYGTPGRYGLGVIAGYQSELPADAHEDDNSCNAADLRGTLPAPTFRDTLTIENPHDVDWIRFHYTNQGVTTTAHVRLHAFPGVHPDSLKDLDLYVVKVPVAGDTVVSVVVADTAPGSDVNLTPSLATGDYYVAIVDFAGTTTTYEVCVGWVPLLGAGTCNTPTWPSPPATSTAAPRRRRPVAGGARSPFVPSRR